MRRSWHSSAALAPGRSSRRQKTCGEPGFTLWTGLLLACRLGWSSPPAIQMRLPATRPAGRLSASSPRPSEPSDLLRLGCTWQLCRVMGHFCVHTMKTLAYLGPTQEQVLVSMSPSEAYHPGGTVILASGSRSRPGYRAGRPLQPSITSHITTHGCAKPAGCA